MTLQEILNMQQALYTLAQQKLPATLAYNIGKAINVVKTASNAVEDKRVAMCKLYGTLNADKTQWEFGDNKEHFDTEMRLFLDAEMSPAPTFFATDIRDLNISLEPIHVAALLDSGVLFMGEDDHA